MSENIYSKLTGLTFSLVTIFLKWRENISKYRTRLFQLLKDTKHTQTTVYKVQRSKIFILEKQMQNLPASVVREPVTDEQVQKIYSQVYEAWG